MDDRLARYLRERHARHGWLETLPLQAERRYPEIAADDTAWQTAERILLSRTLPV